MNFTANDVGALVLNQAGEILEIRQFLKYDGGVIELLARSGLSYRARACGQYWGEVAIPDLNIVARFKQ